MALINCPECDKKVSDKAYACPECGFPIKDYMESKIEDNKEKTEEYISEENIEESDSENKVFSDSELDMLYESENGKRILMIQKVSCDLDYNSAKKIVDDYFKRKFPEKETNLNVNEKINNEIDFDNIIVGQSELDSLYNFTNGNKTLIIQKVARNYNMDYSMARKIVDDYLEKRFQEKIRKNNSNQKKKRFNWKLILLVLVCLVFPFVGAILLWIFKMPHKKIKRVLLTLLLVFYSFIKIVSKSEIEPQSEKPTNDTEIIEEVKEDEVEENTIENETLEIKNENSNAEDVEKSDDDIFLDESKKYFSSDNNKKLLSILKDDIGFEKIVFAEKMGETLNYKIKADGYELVVTDLGDDFRIFIPNSSYVFYEDSKVVMTNENFKSKIVTSDEANIYYIMAQEIISSCLKNPKSADFPSIVLKPGDIGFKKNGNLVLVQSYVDATNSFGATIRSKWEVQFEVLDMETYTYDLKYINFDGEKSGNYIEMD